MMQRKNPKRFYPRQAHRALHRNIACIEMPSKLLADAVSAAKTLPDPLDRQDRLMGQCERHPAVAMLCGWWNTSAPIEQTRCAGYIMVWERHGDLYQCSYRETPDWSVQKFMQPGMSSSLACVGDDVLIEFWKGCAEFTYDGWLGLQTWRVNGQRGWTTSNLEEDVRSGKYDEAWYGLEGLRCLESRRVVTSGDLAYPDAILSGFSLNVGR